MSRRFAASPRDGRQADGGLIKLYKDFGHETGVCLTASLLLFGIADFAPLCEHGIYPNRMSRKKKM